MQSNFLFRALCIGLLWMMTLTACQPAKPKQVEAQSLPTQPPAVDGAPTATQDVGIMPGELPATRDDQAGDVNSSANANRKSAPGGDVFVAGLYERPFNANTMDTYFPYVDIVDAQGFKDATWGYATITLDGTDANGKLPAKYGVELDLNLDGRGDWLILASAPSSTAWSTAGVQAWKDTDGDVGGKRPMTADKMSTGDGYETLVFDQGKGQLRDGAWVRISSHNPNTVELAFQLSMIGNPQYYALGAWAGTDALDPAKFDFNDHMTHVEAGSPLLSYGVYPLKALAEIDNTCRLAIGFGASGQEPGLCKTIQLHPAGPGPLQGPTPEPTPEPPR